VLPRRAAAKGWPEHRPPLPPHCLVSNIIRAAMGLRDAVDFLLATVEPEDEMEKLLGPKIDALDEVMRELGVWVRIGEEVKDVLSEPIVR
jgi:hypothetical protein